MIYTCTLNPAIDLFVETENLLPNKVNRTQDEDYQANGKGVNVSIILKRLGVDSTALGFTAGFTGDYIKDELRNMDISTDFVDIDGITRVNIFVHSQDGEFKIVNQGPVVDSSGVNNMLQKIKALPKHATLFVSGSLPKGVHEDIYKEIAKIAEEKDIELILDISSAILLDCLPYHPYLIKPNDEELAHFFHKDNLTEEEIIESGYQLLDKGAQRVLISLGKNGSIYMDNDHDHVIKASTVKGNVVNTACAGDTMLAMFVQKLKAGCSQEDALKYASAAGASTAFSKGLSDLQDIEELVPKVEITILQGRKR